MISLGMGGKTFSRATTTPAPGAPRAAMRSVAHPVMPPAEGAGAAVTVPMGSGAGLGAGPGAVAQVRVELDLANADRAGRDLDALVLGAELQCLLEGQDARRGQALEDVLRG